MAACRWAGWLALVPALVLTIVHDPAVSDPAHVGSGGFISFAHWWYDGSWAAARLSLAALALHAVPALAVVARAPASAGVRALAALPGGWWRGPALALLLVAWALARGVPHHGGAWRRGELGARTWLREERLARARAPRPSDARAFAGAWRAPDGTVWRFGADAVRREPARTAGGDALLVAYEEVGDDYLRRYDGEALPPRVAALVRAVPPATRVAVAYLVELPGAPGFTGDALRLAPDEVVVMAMRVSNGALHGETVVLRRAPTR
jgi:hypothetical protein